MGQQTTIFNLPFKILEWLFKHPKILILIGLLVVIIIGYQACQSAFAKEQPIEEAVYMKAAPAIDKAPYLLSTTSRLYYVQRYFEDEEGVYLWKYYTYDEAKQKWVYQNTFLPLMRETYYDTDLEVIKRTANEKK